MENCRCYVDNYWHSKIVLVKRIPRKNLTFDFIENKKFYIIHIIKCK